MSDLETFDFSEALRRIKAGATVARESGKYGHPAKDHHLRLRGGSIVTSIPGDDDPYAFRATCTQLMAEDWYEVTKNK